jgi:hypothetical protein
MKDSASMSWMKKSEMSVKSRRDKAYHFWKAKKRTSRLDMRIIIL